MHPCPSCACHVRAADSTCPHCGTTIGSVRRSTAAAVLALTFVACTGGTTKSDSGETADSGMVQPLYGVTITDTALESDTSVTQALYGVTITDTADSATYGVDYGISITD